MTDGPRIGSLFSGYGGLDMGVQQVLGGDVAWHVEYDAAPSRILAHHWPEVPNFGDITSVDWATVEPVDVLTGGFPCQDVSTAGLRRGLKPGTRSGLWAHFALAIDALRPPLVVIENVRGLLSAEAHSDVEHDPWEVGHGGARPPLRALGAVLGDLADIGYDATWAGVRASDAGAPHGRFRVFVLAHPADAQRSGWARRAPDALGQPVGRTAAAGRGAGDAADAAGRGRDGWPARLCGACDAAARRDSPAADAAHERQHRTGGARDRRPGPADSGGTHWGDYGPAIARWQRTLGRVAPSPTERGDRTAQRLSPRFVEWLMGLPAGHVTDVPGLTRNDTLKALGNGVVPQQAALALRTILPMLGT